jgi:hypothetical protein
MQRRERHPRRPPFDGGGRETTKRVGSAGLQRRGFGSTAVMSAACAA